MALGGLRGEGKDPIEDFLDLFKVDGVFYEIEQFEDSLCFVVITHRAQAQTAQEICSKVTCKVEIEGSLELKFVPPTCGTFSSYFSHSSIVLEFIKKSHGARTIARAREVKQRCE